MNRVVKSQLGAGFSSFILLGVEEKSEDFW